MFALRPAIRVRIPVPHASISVIARTQSRINTSAFKSFRYNSTMASASAPLQEWLVIVPDFAEGLQKRLAVRQNHLEGLKADRQDMWLWGGAMLEEPIQPGDTNPPKMKGSAMLIGAKTREEVVERLKADIYVTGGVWDMEKVQIIPFKSALRKAL